MGEIHLVRHMKHITMLIATTLVSVMTFLLIQTSITQAAQVHVSAHGHEINSAHDRVARQEDITALPGIPALSQDPVIASNDVLSTVGNIIQQIIEARVYFPAKTFQDAIEKAARAVFQAELTKLREPLVTVVNQVMFGGIALWGNAALPAPVQDLGKRMAEAAIPLWALSLSIMGLAVLTRNAVGMGFGSNDVASEVVRWLFIAFASANGMTLVNLAHNGFAALCGAVLALGAPDPSSIVGALLPGAFGSGPSSGLAAIPLLILVPGMIIALVTVVVLTLTHIARYALLMAVTGLGPLAIACEGIPFTRFVFNDWVGMFLRLELLGVMNTFILVMFARLNEFNLSMGGGLGGLGWGLLSLVVMVGLASAIIGINLSVFRQVFGAAIAGAQQVKAAGDQMMRVVGAVAGVAATAATGVPVPIGSMTSSSGGASDSSTPALEMPLTGGVNTSTSQMASAGSASPSSSANADSPHEVATTAGNVARALGNATGSPLLQGFGTGAAAGQGISAQHSAAQRLSEQRTQNTQRRGEQLARDLGAVDADDVSAIAASVNAPDNGHTPDQMRRAHQDNAPLLRGMARQYGSPARAAAVGGYDNFGQMANAMAEERLGGNNAESGDGAQSQPISQWMKSDPALTDPGSQNMLPFDFGVGATINQAVGGTPGNAPLWAKTAYSLRSAYGTSYVRQFMQEAQSRGLNERDAMGMVDNQVESTRSASPVYRFWVADTQ